MMPGRHHCGSARVAPVAAGQSPVTGARLARLGRTVFGVHEADDKIAAQKTIDATIQWFKSMNVYLKLSDLGMTRESLQPMIVA